MKAQGDLFPLDIPPECERALCSIKAPELFALVQLCAELTKFFYPDGKRAGRATVVDAVRLFGGQFSNTARRIIGAAARIRSDVWIPDALAQKESVRLARRLLAKRLHPAWLKAGEFLRQVAADGE